LRDERAALADAKVKQGDLKIALTVAREVAQQVQEEAHAKISDIVSHALSAVFDQPYSFKIRFEQKRGRTEAVLVFDRDGVEIDPLTAAGGGVVDVASFALRLSALLLSRPQRRKLLVMDEPFKMLSQEYRPRLKALLETLAKDLGVQMVMVTHDPELRIGAVHEVR
jgi:DNA repair exonuclease SbcCD ATPase subunit